MMLQVEPIKWSTLLSLAYRTAIADRRTYRTENRPLTSYRLWCMLVPSLRRPIFIVGAPRSGTTFLGSCLAELPQISYHFEPIATKAAVPYVYEGRWETTKAKWFYHTVYACLMRLHFDANLRFAEKTPQLSFIISFLSRAFPDAQFVHIIRDGRDAALSYSKKPWLQAAQYRSGKRESGGYLYGPYARFWVEPNRVREFEITSDVHRCIWAWRRHCESVLETSSQLPTNQYHELKYESLVTNPAKEADCLLNFLEISDIESRLRFQRAIAKVKPDSVAQWKRGLTDDQLKQIETEAGELLHRLGYLI